MDVRDSEKCIKGFYYLGYEVGFARVGDERCLEFLTALGADVMQESFNARLKAEGDDNSTNLYLSNLPKYLNEQVSHLAVSYIHCYG